MSKKRINRLARAGHIQSARIKQAGIKGPHFPLGRPKGRAVALNMFDDRNRR